MHRACPKHSIIAAKIEIDKEIAKQKDNGNKVAILSTDLSMAYDTVDHRLLLAKLEHIGLRGKIYNMISSYLAGRKFYTEVQGFNGPIKEMPDTSVIQGSKLSRIFYTLFTINILKYDVLMKNNKTRGLRS